MSDVIILIALLAGLFFAAIAATLVFNDAGQRPGRENAAGRMMVLGFIALMIIGIFLQLMKVLT